MRILNHARGTKSHLWLVFEQSANEANVLIDLASLIGDINRCLLKIADFCKINEAILAVTVGLDSGVEQQDLIAHRNHGPSSQARLGTAGGKHVVANIPRVGRT